jgi:integrase
LATVRGNEVVAGWWREIQLAREGVNVAEWAKAWAKEYKEADGVRPNKAEPSHKDVVEVVISDTLEDFVNHGEMTLREAKNAFEVATGQRVLLADHQDDYLKQYKTSSLKTQAAYAAALGHFLSFFKVHSDVTSKSVKAWLTHMADEKELGQETISRSLRQAQSFRRYLAEHEVVPRDWNPFPEGISVPKTAKKQEHVVPFTPQQVVQILTSEVAQKDWQLSTLIILAMYTGARIEELATLKRSDLDMVEHAITINGTKTDAAHRVVPMHPVLIELLSTFPFDESDEYVIAGFDIDKRGERGKALGKRFGRLKTSLGFHGRTKCFHSIRKTFTTLMEQADVSEGVTADIVGHEKQTMTYGLYSGGTSMKQKRDAINRIKYPAHPLLCPEHLLAKAA